MFLVQNQIQDHLQRKHEELQKLIIEQQNELRRVSEQLFVARYGLHTIIPSSQIVTVPQLGPVDQSEDSSRCINSSTYVEQQVESQSQFEVSQPNAFQSIHHDDFELIPFQMNHQAQILFSSGNNDNDSNVSK